LGRDTTKVDSSLVFHTDHGRTVLGGGGIRPDLFIKPDTFTTVERAFLKALGSKIPTYQDVRASYALEVKGSGRVKSPAFSVTPEMVDEVLRRLRARGVAVPDSVVAGARTLIADDLGHEITRYVFGRPSEVRRRMDEDRQVQAALALVRRAKSPARGCTRRRRYDRLAAGRVAPLGCARPGGAGAPGRIARGVGLTAPAPDHFRPRARGGAPERRLGRCGRDAARRRSGRAAGPGRRPTPVP